MKPEATGDATQEPAWVRAVLELVRNAVGALPNTAEDTKDTPGQGQLARDAISPAIDRVWAWIKRIAKAAGKKASEFYRQSAPQNWVGDDTVVDYVSAVRLALDEGIPLAWVPDRETVQLLVAVRGHGEARRAELHRILDERCEIILDFCDDRLRALRSSPDIQQMADFARQGVEALRHGLNAPAQAAATNLVDQLLWAAFNTIYGNYGHSSARRQVENLAQLTNKVSFTFLGALRELATIMPVVNALTPWRPGDGTPPPPTFSRHVTTHHIAAAGQVTRVNALVAVMLAVSLLSQWHDSRWRGLVTLRTLDDLRASRR